MNESVWVVEQGSYSDYHVVGVYSTQENAEMIAARINKNLGYDAATVDEWPLDPAVNELNRGLSGFRVTMLRDGSVHAVKPAERWEGVVFTEEADLSAYPFAGSPGPFMLIARVWARDEQHAVKIANERRIQMIAANEWPEAAGAR